MAAVKGQAMTDIKQMISPQSQAGRRADFMSLQQYARRDQLMTA